MGEFNFSDLPERDLMCSIRLFGEKEIPALRGTTVLMSMVRAATSLARPMWGSHCRLPQPRYPPPKSCDLSIFRQARKAH